MTKKTLKRRFAVKWRTMKFSREGIVLLREIREFRALNDDIKWKRSGKVNGGKKTAAGFNIAGKI